MALTSSLSVSTLLLVSAALPMASGHDHDSSHIEDGKTISVEPIVRVPLKQLLGRIGLDWIECWRMTRNLTASM
jgi:hypothetical protein